MNTMQAAAGLHARGVRAGDVIAVQLPNSVPFVATLLAAGALGATVQMLHMPYRRAELSTLLADISAGRVRPKVYRQFKMYNDPAYK